MALSTWWSWVRWDRWTVKKDLINDVQLWVGAVVAVTSPTLKHQGLHGQAEVTGRETMVGTLWVWVYLSSYGCGWHEPWDTFFFGKM